MQVFVIFISSGWLLYSMLMASIAPFSSLKYTVIISFIGLVLAYILILAPPTLLSTYPIITPPETMGVYTRTDLLQFRDSFLSNASLPQDTWRTISSLGIVKAKFQPTHRGCREGRQVKQK